MISFSDTAEDRADGHGRGAAHEDYVAWLDRHFGLAPATDPDDVVAATEQEYAQRFVAWMDRYVDGFAAEYEELTAR